MSKNHDIITVSVKLKHETAAAYLVNGGDKDVWVPKSQCEYSDGELQLPEWLALEKGLI